MAETDRGTIIPSCKEEPGTMERCCALLKENGADLVKIIDPKSVVTAAWTVYRCRYGCGCYGQSHCCPPNTPTWRETRDMLDCYEKAILFRCHDGAQPTKLAVMGARQLFLDGYYKAAGFGAGPCKRCHPCNKEHCNFPYEVVPSMEGCGIDVFATVRGNGIPIHTLREKGEEGSFFGMILVE